MWNIGTFGNIELLLSTLHVLVSNFNGHWCRVPLVVYANVRNISIIMFLTSVLWEKFLFFSSTLQGKTSHKFFDPSENFIMRLYYQKDVLTFMCFCNEMFYSGLYLLHFTNGPTSKHLNLTTSAFCTRTNLHNYRNIFFKFSLQFWAFPYLKY